MNKQRKADLLLVMVTAFWGMSYFLTDLCLSGMTPMSLNAFRFMIGFGVLAICFWKKMWPISRATLKYGILIGLSLVCVYVCYGYGILHTSITNAGFICALPVVTTPIIEFLVTKRRPSNKLFFALALCTVGLGMLTLNDQFKPALGDILCLGTAIFYGVDLVLTDRGVHQPDVDPLQLGVIQLGVVGVVTLIMTLTLEKPNWPPTPQIWASVLFLAIFCTGIAFVIQTVQQQHTTATHVGLIFTMEPVFSAIVAFTLGGERLRPVGYVGAVIMMISLVLMEADLSVLKRKKK